MFRVPSDAENPTFDVTTKVGFFRWLTSKATDRHEWRRRRDMAAQTARRNQNQRASDWLQERQRREAEAKRLKGQS